MQDYKETVRWFHKVAEQGMAAAQEDLGRMHYYGQGVPQDYEEAVTWYRYAAEQGHAEARYNLGMMYYQGQGVPQDYVLAHMWFNLAATQGDVDAMNGRDWIAEKMTREQIADAQKLAREWKPEE